MRPLEALPDFYSVRDLFKMLCPHVCACVCVHMHVCAQVGMSVASARLCLGTLGERGFSEVLHVAAPDEPGGPLYLMLCGRGEGPRGGILCLGSLGSEQANDSGHEAGLGRCGSSQGSEAEGALAVEYQSAGLWQQWGRWRLVSAVLTGA